VSAALLAAAGFTSPERVLEAPRGFLKVLAARSAESEITAALGARWELMHNAYKPYPCGIVTHPVIDGCLELRAAHHLLPADIVKLEVIVNPLARTLCDRAAPRDSLEGKLSLQHTAAVALCDGEVGVAQFLDPRVRSPDVDALRDKVVLTTDEATGLDQARVRVTLVTGARHETFITHARGSLQRPLTDAELDAKFRALAATELSPPQVGRLAEQCWNLEQLPDASVIARGSCAK
jgi:2-methylcitrate dehydratase PrpD